MKFALATIAANVVSGICVVAAVVLAINDKDGWGWFLFVAVLCAGSVKFGGNED